MFNYISRKGNCIRPILYANGKSVFFDAKMVFHCVICFHISHYDAIMHPYTLQLVEIWWNDVGFVDFPHQSFVRMGNMNTLSKLFIFKISIGYHLQWTIYQFIWWFSSHQRLLCGLWRFAKPPSPRYFIDTDCIRLPVVRILNFNFKV